ncbi:MAG: hypothetical protein L7H18_01615 [Candidatus Nealsonbacteria bacterium DGGOD1a]|nr:MAG: hypothetical protein L7H18_01615 [Candidatus Nealsonbacteria bacterium DGGOD1a]
MNRKRELDIVKSFLKHENISFTNSDFNQSENLDKKGIDVVFKNKKIQVTGAPSDKLEVQGKVLKAREKTAEAGNARYISETNQFEYNANADEVWEKFISEPLKKKINGSSPFNVNLSRLRAAGQNAISPNASKSA